MNETPQQRLDHYVGGHLKLVRSLGGEVDGSSAARGIATILEIADRGDPGTVDTRGHRDAADVHESKRLQGPEALADKFGGEFSYGDERVEPLISSPKAAPVVPNGVEGEKHWALIARLAILMAPIPGYRLKPGEDIGNKFQHPRFATMLERTTAHAQLNDDRSIGSGIYKGLPLADRRRRYYRRLEDICDQSNAVIGFGWFVKH